MSLAPTYLDRVVTSVTLSPDLSFAERPNVPTLSGSQRRTLAKRVATPAASGLAQAAGPQMRVSLLLNGAPVSALHFDRASGILLAEPPERDRGGRMTRKRPRNNPRPDSGRRI